ncbi:hypothetical protein ACFVFD_36485, partial [Streptomyces fimicarius]
MGIQDRKIVARARLRPRAFGALSAEDLTAVESGQNRTHLVLLSREEFDDKAFAAADVEGGPEARSALMSAFVIWWAARMPAYAAVTDLESRFAGELATATGAPGRYIESAADKAAGMFSGLEFALSRGWVTEERSAELWARGWAGLCESLSAQVDANAGQSMADRIRDAILDGLSVGAAHVLDVQGEMPRQARELGWQGEHPQGTGIGWVDGERLYLLPSAAASFVVRYSADAGAPIEITSRAMGEALETAGYITGSDERQAGRVIHRHTVARKVMGRKRNVWSMALPAEADGPEGGQGGQGGPEAPLGPEGPDTAPIVPLCRGCGGPLDAAAPDPSGYHPTCDPAATARPAPVAAPQPTPEPEPEPQLPEPQPEPAPVATAPRKAPSREPQVCASIADRVAEALDKARGDVDKATAALIKTAIPDAMELLEATRVSARYDFTAHPPEPEILRKPSKNGANEVWEARPKWTNPNTPKGTEVHLLDVNAAYLAALNTHLP